MLTFLPRSLKAKYWNSTETFGYCCVYWSIRFLSHGRCCGFSHVQKVSLTGARVGAPWAAPKAGIPSTPTAAAPTLVRRRKSRLVVMIRLLGGARIS